MNVHVARTSVSPNVSSSGAPEHIQMCSNCSHSIPAPKFGFPPPTLTEWDPNDGETLLTPSQINANRTADQEATSQMAVYELQLARVRSLKHKLEAERSALEQYRQDCQLVLSNNILRQLPPEILGEIFTWACLPTSTFCCLAELESRTALRLSVVCSWWRAVALANPHIWAVASFVAHDFGWYEEDQDTVAAAEKELSRLTVAADILAVYLQRSQYVLLDVRITHSPYRHTPQILDCVRTMTLAIAMHSHRWRSASFSVDSLDAWLSANQPLPELESLKLRGIRNFIEQSTPLPTPRLRRLDLGSTTMDVCDVADHLQVTNVVDLKVISRETRLDDLFGLCRRLPELQVLDIFGDINWATETATLPISTLKVQFRRSSSLQRFLNYLTLPRLECLHLNAVRLEVGDSATFSQSLTSLITRSECSLRHLTLTRLRHLSDADFLTILKKTPYLQSLTALERGQPDRYLPVVPALTQHFFATLSITPATILPQIQKLRFEIRPVSAEESEGLHAAVEELKRSRSSVEITVYFAGEKDTDHYID